MASRFGLSIHGLSRGEAFIMAGVFRARGLKTSIHEEAAQIEIEGKVVDPEPKDRVSGAQRE